MNSCLSRSQSGSSCLPAFVTLLATDRAGSFLSHEHAQGMNWPMAPKYLVLGDDIVVLGQATAMLAAMLPHAGRIMHSLGQTFSMSTL
jgi:hypothetical protein